MPAARHGIAEAPREVRIVQAATVSRTLPTELESFLRSRGWILSIHSKHEQLAIQLSGLGYRPLTDRDLPGGKAGKELEEDLQRWQFQLSPTKTWERNDQRLFVQPLAQREANRAHQRMIKEQNEGMAGVEGHAEKVEEIFRQNGMDQVHVEPTIAGPVSDHASGGVTELERAQIARQ